MYGVLFLLSWEYNALGGKLQVTCRVAVAPSGDQKLGYSQRVSDTGTAADRD
jgi:hypothetical protein